MKILQTPIGISMLAIQSSWPHYRPLYKANEPYKSTLLKRFHIGFNHDKLSVLNQ